MKKISLLAINIILLSNFASAYIDPGTGGIIASSLWPLILAFFSAVGALLVKYFWAPIKKFFVNIVKAKK